MNPKHIWSAIQKIVNTDWPEGTDPLDAADPIFYPLNEDEKNALNELKLLAAQS